MVFRKGMLCFFLQEVNKGGFIVEQNQEFLSMFEKFFALLVPYKSTTVFIQK